MEILALGYFIFVCEWKYLLSSREHVQTTLALINSTLLSFIVMKWNPLYNFCFINHFFVVAMIQNIMVLSSTVCWTRICVIGAATESRYGPGGLRGQAFSLIPSSVLWVCFIFPVRCVLVSHSNKKGMEHGRYKHQSILWCYIMLVLIICSSHAQ